MATLAEKFKFDRDDFTRKKTLTRDNGFTGKDTKGRDIEKSGADNQWTKADVGKCP